jgi:predicted MFS family arabinose efflux permease
LRDKTDPPVNGFYLKNKLRQFDIGFNLIAFVGVFNLVKQSLVFVTDFKLRFVAVVYLLNGSDVDVGMITVEMILNGHRKISQMQRIIVLMMVVMMVSAAGNQAKGKQEDESFCATHAIHLK